jgi:phenylacetate-CoA ligase
MELDEIPVLERAELRARFEDLRSAGTVPVALRRTSGSTGRPVRAVHGPATIGYAAAARLRQLTWFGLDPVDHPQLNMRIAAAADEPVLWRDERPVPLFWLNPFRLTGNGLAAVHAELLAAGGVRLAGAESSLLLAWARLYEQGDSDPGELGLRLLIAGGEMTELEHRRVPAAVFGCPVAELYGSHELGIIAAECPDGSLHVAEEAVVVELLGPDGREVPAGEHGEVVASLLHNTEMPILRYRLGDVAAREPGPCPCGRTGTRLQIGVGRREEMVAAPSGRMLHPRFLRTVYERRFGAALRAFHTTQVGPSAFTVRIDLDGPAPADAAETLAGELASYLGAPVEVEVEVGPVAEPGDRLRTFSRAPDQAR